MIPMQWISLYDIPYGAEEIFHSARKQLFLSTSLSETIFMFVPLLAGNNYSVDELQYKSQVHKSKNEIFE